MNPVVDANTAAGSVKLTVHFIKRAASHDEGESRHGRHAVVGTRLQDSGKRSPHCENVQFNSTNSSVMLLLFFLFFFLLKTVHQTLLWDS